MYRNLAFAFISLFLTIGPFSANAFSDQLCQAKKIKVNKKGIAKPSIKLVKTAKCPRGFKALIDLAAVLGQGIPGPKGDPGVSATDPLPTGKTIVGVIGGDFQQDDTNLGDWRVLASLPISAPAALKEEDVLIQNNDKVDNDCLGEPCVAASELAKPAVCTGSFANPSAPQGKLCIYTLSSVNARSLRSFPVPLNPDAPARGISVSWSVMGPGDTFFNGIWAYTAP